MILLDGSDPELHTIAEPIYNAAIERSAELDDTVLARGQALEAAIARQTQCAIGGIHAAGGRDYEDQRIDWGALANGSDSMVIVAEGWEAPDKALLRLVGDLRRAIGPRRHITVLLAHVSEDGIRPSLASEVRIWNDGLAPLEDPYLAVEPLRGAP